MSLASWNVSEIMRLLDSVTLELREFPDNAIPHYAILSHTWQSEEVSYSDMLHPSEIIREKAGYIKIKQFASLVSRLGWKWIWVDTCCIRKDSSAELSEAINSMYRWYKNARRCYVYLEDLESATWNSVEKKHEALQKCRWLTRGWTLQEMIAPSDCHFYSKGWEFLFTKTNWAFQLSMMLGISQEVLLTCDPSLASVAQRMSWAARRETTRPEDMAYCLLGLFDVNMPMLYGEGGEKAFIRLQEEIMKSSDDHSLFVWRAKEKSYSSYTGLLAQSPKNFIASRNVASVDNLQDDQPFSNTNKGVSLKLNLMPRTDNSDESDVYIALLNCRDPGPEGEPVGIYLKNLGHNQYARIDAHSIFNAIDLQPAQVNEPSKDIGRSQERKHPFNRGDDPVDAIDLPAYPIRFSSRDDHLSLTGKAKRSPSKIYQPKRVPPTLYVPDMLVPKPNTHPGKSGATRNIPSASGRSDIGSHRNLSSDSEEEQLPTATPTSLYVRQNIRLPAGHLSPRVYGFVVTEFIQMPGLYLSDVWPVESWSSQQRCFRILPSDQEKKAVICYNLRDEPSFGVLAIVLRWERKSRAFSTNCVHDASWLAALPAEERIKGLENLVGSTKAEQLLKIDGGQQKAKVNMELAMRGDDVVIKVGISVR